MLHKKLSQITLADLEALQSNKVPEGRLIEYKSQAVGRADKDKKNFLADVSAFANAGGGDLLFGITEEDGLPTLLTGIELKDLDEEKRRLGDIIRMGLEPTLNAVEMHWVPLPAGNGVFIIRIPRSWRAPHRVTFNRDMNFYVRNAAGQHPMSIEEIRDSFALSESITERVRQFREQRINLIHSNESPLPLGLSAKLIVHAVPLVSFVDPPALNFEGKLQFGLPPIHASGFDYLHCLEGLVTFFSDGSSGYNLIFRNGIIESVTVVGFEHNRESLVALVNLEEIILYIWKFLQQHSERVDPPYYIFVSLTELRGHKVYLNGRYFLSDATPLRREKALLPEMEILGEALLEDGPQQLKPLFDLLANTFGLPGSPSFTSSGAYNPRQ